MPARPAMLIALPCGLSAGGVTTWALRLGEHLTGLGHQVTLVLHRLRPGDTPIDATIPPGVHVVDLTHLPAMDDAGFAPELYLPHYRAAMDAKVGEGLVVISPNLMGDNYALAAALSQERPERLRTIGWCHLDSEYDRCVLAHYEPILHAFVGVSHLITRTLRDACPGREREVHDIPYGVEVPDTLPVRAICTGRPLRLIYPGRIDENVKRVSALIHLSDELAALGVAHELTLVGDGPAATEIDLACAARPAMKRLPPSSPAKVGEMLRASDLLVLPSRVEGLSIAMLEAMGQGCIPVVTNVRSGAAQAITHHQSGLLVETDASTDAREVGRAMARAIAGLDPARMPDVSRSAWEQARAKYSIQFHASRVSALLTHVASLPARSWPSSRPCGFTATGPGGSGTVPADAAARLSSLLNTLHDRRVLIHGTGRHTIELAEVLASHASCIVGLSDDDPARHGSTILGWPVVAPGQATSLGASDVIISSCLHQEAIWARRGVYENAGLRVHRLYPSPRLIEPQPSSPSASTGSASRPA